MPECFVTLDYIDGKSKIRGPLSPDEIDLHGLLFRLCERDIATITFSRANPLQALQRAEQERKNTATPG